MIADRELYELALEECRPGCRHPQRPICAAHYAAAVLSAIAASRVDRLRRYPPQTGRSVLELIDEPDED